MASTATAAASSTCRTGLGHIDPGPVRTRRISRIGDGFCTVLPDHFATGPDPERHIRQLRQYLDAGVDELYVQQIGPDLDGFFTAWEKEIQPTLS